MQKLPLNILASLPLGELRYFDTIGSTNDEALAWAIQGAPDCSLVVADEQTQGRGRAGRRWITPRGTALAFSLILRPTPAETNSPALVTGLAAISVVEALKKAYCLEALIKWPNDVLIGRKKIAGILVESVWAGDCLDAMVVGIGVNVLQESQPAQKELLFPATSLEAELSAADEKRHHDCNLAVDRWRLLREIVATFLEWRPRLGSEDLRNAWERYLAFRGEPVRVWTGSEQPLIGHIIGLAGDGRLRLLVGERIEVIPFGEIHLRPSL